MYRIRKMKPSEPDQMTPPRRWVLERENDDSWVGWTYMGHFGSQQECIEIIDYGYPRIVML